MTRIEARILANQSAMMGALITMLNEHVPRSRAADCKGYLQDCIDQNAIEIANALAEQEASDGS